VGSSDPEKGGRRKAQGQGLELKKEAGCRLATRFFFSLDR
jgi:hypothetical protein